jgi:hypothetical protein
MATPRPGGSGLRGLPSSVHELACLDPQLLLCSLYGTADQVIFTTCIPKRRSDLLEILV